MSRDLRSDIARGARAASELTETEAAFDAVRGAILKTLAETPVGSDAKVLKLHMSVQNLTAVREALMRVVDAGAHANYAREAEDAIAVAGLTRP